jgi:AcrR family transcriptional regulator
MLRASTEEEKEQRRTVILGAATRVFAANGFHATTIKDVARAAEVSYGLVYRYFPSKDALFHALLDERALALRQHIAEAMLAGPSDGAEVLRRAVRATFEFFESDRDVARLLFRDALVLGDRFDRHLTGIYERFIGDVEQAIRAAQAAGQVIDAPPNLIATSVAAQISQLALRRIETDDGLPAGEVADIVVRLVLDGLRPRRR